MARALCTLYNFIAFIAFRQEKEESLNTYSSFEHLQSKYCKETVACKHTLSSKEWHLFYMDHLFYVLFNFEVF